MARHEWRYSDAGSHKAGLMICTACGEKIKTGEFRYRETNDAYKCQHRKCSEGDKNWKRLDAEAEAMNSVKVPVSPMDIAESIKSAFFEGYDSYVTQACSYTSSEDEWKESDAKRVYDAIIGVSGQ